MHRSTITRGPRRWRPRSRWWPKVVGPARRPQLAVRRLRARLEREQRDLRRLEASQERVVRAWTRPRFGWSGGVVAMAALKRFVPSLRLALSVTWLIEAGSTPRPECPPARGRPRWPRACRRSARTRVMRRAFVALCTVPFLAACSSSSGHSAPASGAATSGPASAPTTAAPAAPSWTMFGGRPDRRGATASGPSPAGLHKAWDVRRARW